MKLNIAYAPDDKYTNQTIVSIVSAIENNKKHQLEFIIMYSKLSDDNMEKFKKLNFDNVKIRMLKIDETLFNNLPLSKWVTVQAWFRIALPDLCKDLDKICYLDCDTLVRGDLEELFRIDLTNKYLGGVKDVWGVLSHVKRLSMESNIYLNSGMLLLNADFCRKESFFEKITNFANSNKSIIEFCDQDAINKVVDINKVVLHPKYNFMDTWWRGGYHEHEAQDELDYLNAQTNAIIVHLTGIKPAFKGCKNIFKDEWWQYAEKTSVYNELKLGFDNSQVPQEPFTEKLFSIKNEYHKKNKTKILKILGLKFKLGKSLTFDDIQRKERKKEHIKKSKQKFVINNFIAPNYVSKTNIDLITISFNNPKVIEYQIRLIKKFVKGSYTIIIADNSNEITNAEKIKKVCESENVTFIRITPKQLPNGYSDSHGIALNWVYKNIVLKRKKDFALLDHDIVPVQEVMIEKYIATQDFFGLVCYPHCKNWLNKNLWYLWPGFAFYKYNSLVGKKINFNKLRKFGFLKIKVIGADTGSAIWPSLYSKYNLNRLKMCDAYFWDIRNNCKFINQNLDNNVAQTNLIQYYDKGHWLHIINGAEWTDSKGKLDLVYNLFDRYLI